MIDVPGHLNWSTFSRIDKEREDSEMTLVVTLAFRNRVVDSYSCFSSHLVGFTLSCLKAILVDLCGFCLVWLRPRFVLFRCFLCWRNANLAGRFAGRRCCRFLFVLVVFVFP